VHKICTFVRSLTDIIRPSPLKRASNADVKSTCAIAIISRSYIYDLSSFQLNELLFCKSYEFDLLCQHWAKIALETLCSSYTVDAVTVSDFDAGLLSLASIIRSHRSHYLSSNTYCKKVHILRY